MCWLCVCERGFACEGVCVCACVCARVSVCLCWVCNSGVPPHYISTFHNINPDILKCSTLSDIMIYCLIRIIRYIKINIPAITKHGKLINTEHK